MDGSGWIVKNWDSGLEWEACGVRDKRRLRQMIMGEIFFIVPLTVPVRGTMKKVVLESIYS